MVKANYDSDSLLRKHNAHVIEISGPIDIMLPDYIV